MTKEQFYGELFFARVEGLIELYKEYRNSFKATEIKEYPMPKEQFLITLIKEGINTYQKMMLLK